MSGPRLSSFTRWGAKRVEGMSDSMVMAAERFSTRSAPGRSSLNRSDRSPA